VSSIKVTTIVLSACLAGCASQNGKFYDGETLPSDKVAVVSLPLAEATPMVFVPTSLNVEIDKHRLFTFKEQNIGYFKPGDYEFKLIGLWWDRQNKSKNAVRDVAVTPCLMGVYAPFPFLPLAIACGALTADKNCKSNWTMSLEPGNKYTIDVDWSIDAPQTKVKNESTQVEVFSTACEIQKQEQPK
jgi:hypothetical protein